MIAVTIGTGEYYAKLAHHAAQAVEKMTGLKTIVLGDEQFKISGLRYSHHLKLRIFDLVDHDEIMFFDSDMVCLKPWNPQRFAKPDAIVAVAERLHPMIVRACKEWDIPIQEYFNAGLIIFNRKAHHEWLRETERFVIVNPGVPSYDPYDQTPLNITRHRMGLRLDLLDRRYNWVGFGTGTFDYEVPLYMAHGLKPYYKFANIDYFEGRYKPPFRWHIRINEEETGRLKNQTLRLKGAHQEKTLHLNCDGTIGPPYYPGAGRHWFVHETPDGPRLAITSDTELLREFTRTDNGAWESVQELCLDGN